MSISTFKGLNSNRPHPPSEHIILSGHIRQIYGCYRCRDDTLFLGSRSLPYTSLAMELWETLRVLISKLGCGSRKGELLENDLDREVKLRFRQGFAAICIPRDLSFEPKVTHGTCEFHTSACISPAKDCIISERKTAHKHS